MPLQADATGVAIGPARQVLQHLTLGQAVAAVDRQRRRQRLRRCQALPGAHPAGRRRRIRQMHLGALLGPIDHYPRRSA